MFVRDCRGCGVSSARGTHHCHCRKGFCQFLAGNNQIKENFNEEDTICNVYFQFDSTSLSLSRKTGIFDQRDKPKYVTCLAYASNGDVITGDSNGNVFIWGRGYNAVTKVIRKVHDGPIFSICVLKDGSVITGGGRDSRIVKFDTLYRKTGLEAQLPEHLGSIRTVSQGKGSQLLVGTTKNSILTGNFDLNFQEIMVGHVGEVLLTKLDKHYVQCFLILKDTWDETAQYMIQAYICL